MAVTFDFETISEVGGVVTRKLTIQPDASVVAPFYAAVQFNLGYEGAVVSITERTLMPDSRGVTPIMNPSTVDGLAQTSQLRAAAISSVGFSAADSLLELVYSHDTDSDPVFVLSGLMVDDTMLILDGVQFSADTASEVEIPVVDDEVPVVDDEVPVVDDEVPSSDDSDSGGDDNIVVSAVLGSAGSLYLYWFANDRIGISAQAVAAGEQVAANTILDFRMTANSFLSGQTLVDSGVSELQFREQDGSYLLTLSFQDGAQSILSFAVDTGLLTSSVDTPADEGPSTETPGDDAGDSSGDELIEDGVNLGTGITDSVGIEVPSTEIRSLLHVTESAFVSYRQRLGDAVALEATNRDGSVVGKIIGDPDARFLGQVSNGSTELIVDLPAGTTLDLLGLAGNTTGSGAARYLNGLVDSEIPTTNAGSAQWNGSLKQAISKASAKLSDVDFKLDVITPTRQIADSDELAIAYAGDGNALGAINLSQTDDLITVSGYEGLVAVGPGRMSVSGSSDASVYGDIHGQVLTGGRGNDFLSGGGGLDTLAGGDGADTFELGFGGTTTISDLTAEDTVQFDLFGVESLEQLNSRIQSVGPGESGLRVQFNTFAVELVGYSDLSQIQSGIAF